MTFAYSQSTNKQLLRLETALHSLVWKSLKLYVGRLVSKLVNNQLGVEHLL